MKGKKLIMASLAVFTLLLATGSAQNTLSYGVMGPRGGAGSMSHWE